MIKSFGFLYKVILEFYYSISMVFIKFIGTNKRNKMDQIFFDKLAELYTEEDGVNDNFLKEEKALKLIFKKIGEKLGNQYDIVKPLGRGGAGIVVKLWDKVLEVPRALKIPRPIKDELLDTLTNEMSFLKSIHHENVINIYDLGEIDLKLEGIDSRKFPYFIMDYIDSAVNLLDKFNKLIEIDVENKNLNGILKFLVDSLLSLSKAFDYLHQNEIMHFDVKPSNILINHAEKPIITDLGFAKKRSSSKEKLVIGFTLYYAHPELKLSYLKFSDKNRVKKEIAPCDFKNSWDLYAFGKSILEILALINFKYSDKVYLDYNFIYLHLFACRLLDGKNMSKTEFENLADVQRNLGKKELIFPENWNDLEAKELKEIKFDKFSEIIIDLDKLRSSDYFHSLIPELEIFPLKKIHISDTNPASFTKRVQRVIEHPIFKRLVNIHQLDLLYTVYPTATHTRFEHSIGVYRNCCLFINSLFNDKYNPLFKQLVNEDDLKAIIFISLIHDIGHYPFAHEIEETTSNLQYKHEEILKKLLNSDIKDKYGNTLKEILEDNNFGWGITIMKIENILKSNSFTPDLFDPTNLKHKMLLSILDGPIDIDKLDYLIRDSQNTYLKYGQLIDVERLISNLTIITDKKDGRLDFIVGTYEKGQTAAESLIFARYLLYRSLYWHHTARSIRTMLTTALSNILSIKPDTKKKSFTNDFNEFILGTKSNNYTLDNLLNIIYENVEEPGKMLISQLRERSYYKRILTVHHNTLNENGREILTQYRSLVKTKRNLLNSKLQEVLTQRYSSVIASMNPMYRVSALSTEITDKTLVFLKEPNMIICDAPEPSFGMKGKTPRFIPEPQRLQHTYAVRKEVGNKVSEVWEKEYFTLMEIASKGRIYCHPEIRNNIMAALSPKLIQEALETAMHSL